MYYLVFGTGFILAFITILALLVFFRYGVGSDYFAYNYLYNLLDTSLISEFNYSVGNQEVLFRLIGSLLKRMDLHINNI